MAADHNTFAYLIWQIVRVHGIRGRSALQDRATAARGDDVSSLFDWAQRLPNGWGVKPLRAGNGVAGYATSANTVDPHSIVVGRVGAQCGNVHVVRGPACATDNALLLRDISEFDVAKLEPVRAATEHTIALLRERRAALIAVAATGQFDVMGSAA